MTAVEGLKSGTKICGTLVRMIRNPALPLIAKAAGLDFLLFDMEHGPYSLDTLSDIAMTARSAGVGIFARVPCLDKSYISRALDAGIEGIMVPMIDTPEEAKSFVALAKYEPVGRRGLGSNGGLCDYSGMAGKSTGEFMVEQNRKTLTIAQIETSGAVKNIDAIAAVEGIDVLLVGPTDLSIALGIPGDFLNEKEIRAINSIARAASGNKKYFSLYGPLELQEKFKGHIDMIMMSSDIDVITRGFSALLHDMSTVK
jgi:2-keto-3-deoxy-L-rhamnonate aldolase RhmA